jgi:hypothetical protein
MYSLRDIDLRKEVEIEPYKREGNKFKSLHNEGCPTIFIPPEQVPYFIGDVRDANGLDCLLGALSPLSSTQSTELLTACMPIEWLRSVWPMFTDRPLSEAWTTTGCDFVAIHFEKLRAIN